MTNTTNTNGQNFLIDRALESGMIECMTSETKRTRRANRTGCLIDKGPGRPYLCKYTDVDGKVKYKSSGETNRNRALAKLDELTRASREDSVEDMITMLEAQLRILRAKKKRPELALVEIWDAVENDFADVGKNTVKGYRGNLRLMCEWMTRHGVRNAEGITPDLTGEYLREIQSQIGKVSYNCRLVLFRRIWKLLSEAGYSVAENAWTKHDKLKGCKHESIRKALTPGEVKRVTEAAEQDADLHLVMIIGQYTGMRLSDCANLKWADVDFGGKKIVTTPIKTKRHGMRVTIPMHPKLEAELLKAKETATGEYVSAANARNYSTGKLDRMTSELFTRCGFQTSTVDANGKRKLVYGFHSLRHTVASNLANSGASMATIQSILGHSSADMSLHYCHADEEKAREAMTKVA